MPSFLVGPAAAGFAALFSLARMSGVPSFFVLVAGFGGGALLGVGFCSGAAVFLAGCFVAFLAGGVAVLSCANDAVPMISRDITMQMIFFILVLFDAKV